MSVSGSHYHNNHDKQHHFWGQADFTGPGGPLQDHVTARRNRVGYFWPMTEGPAMVPPEDLDCVWLACKAVYAPEESIPRELEKNDFDQIDSRVYQKSDAHASSYLVARSRMSPDTVFVVFRGTQDLSDMIADFNCQPREIDTIDDLAESLYVHGGIYETSKQSMKNIFAKLNEENQRRAIVKVIFTGHSLGGACALAARFIALEQAELQSTSSQMSKRAARCFTFSPQFRVVTFGAPLLFSHGSRLDNKDNVETILQHRCLQTMQARAPVLCLDQELPAQPLPARAHRDAQSHARLRLLRFHPPPLSALSGA